MAETALRKHNDYRAKHKGIPKEIFTVYQLAENQILLSFKAFKAKLQGIH